MVKITLAISRVLRPTDLAPALAGYFFASITLRIMVEITLAISLGSATHLSGSGTCRLSGSGPCRFYIVC